LQSWLDNFKALNGLTNNSDGARVTSHGPSKTAQRRLGKAINTTYAELKIANRRSRLGQTVVLAVPQINRARRSPRRA
jgi:hypothetical protein